MTSKDVTPELKRVIRNSTDAFEAANAAGLIAGNCSMIFCTQKREEDVRSAPSGSLDEKMYKWLSFSPQMPGERWTTGMYSKHNNVPNAALQKAITYHTTVTTEYKKIRAGMAQGILLARRDECSDLAHYLGLANEFEQFANATVVENTKAERNNKWFILDFAEHKVAIIAHILKNTKIVATIMTEYGAPEDEAKQVAIEAFENGFNGDVELVVEENDEAAQSVESVESVAPAIAKVEKDILTAAQLFGTVGLIDLSTL